MQDGRRERVAVKRSHSNMELTKAQIEEMMREARVQKNFDHPNVVRFYGIAAEQPPVMIVMEFVLGGSLDTFLKKNAGLITFDNMTVTLANILHIPIL